MYPEDNGSHTLLLSIPESADGQQYRHRRIRNLSKPHYGSINALRECNHVPLHTSAGRTIAVDLGSYLHPSTAFRSVAASIWTEKSFLEVNSNRSRSSRKARSAIAGNS